MQLLHITARVIHRLRFVLALALLSAFVLSRAMVLDAATAPGARAPTIIKDIPYPGAPKGDRRRSLDLYLPADSGRKPPLLAFVHGGLWQLSDDDYRIGPTVAEALVREGVAVALVRYRLGAQAKSPAQAEDVVAAVALLVREAQRYGYDGNRIYLSGHDAGGHLAAWVALDPSFLGRHNLNAKSLAGVVIFSGIYDLAPKWGVVDNEKIAIEKTFGKDRAALKRASPMSHSRGDAPSFLILSSQNDIPGFALDAKRFFDSLRARGHARVERWIASERDHFTLMRLGDPDNEARYLLLEFLKVSPLPPAFKILVDAKRRWQDPPFSTLPFWRYKKLIRSYPVDQRLATRLVTVYSTLRYELQEWPMETYHAIDLFEFLDSLPADKVGRGEYLVTTNVRQEKQYWKREQLRPYKPVIVIGLDDEKNLFRFGVFYRGNVEYSWKTGSQPPLMSRPLGAFIHFLKDPPPEISPHPAQFALTEASFRLAAEDPLAGLKDLRKDIYETLTFRNGCIYCHTLRGVGAKSHHVTATAGTPHGGLALPLESYPAEVWKSFIFDQTAIAKKIGASPNPVAEGTRQAFFELVNKSRQAQTQK
jgi:acetyl esterase/lipase